jgi:Flp pilus assembly pilin Flp
VSRSIRHRLIAFVRNEEGVTAVECALMLALVVVICLVALTPSSTTAPAATVRLERQ